MIKRHCGVVFIFLLHFALLLFVKNCDLCGKTPFLYVIKTKNLKMFFLCREKFQPLILCTRYCKRKRILLQNYVYV